MPESVAAFRLGRIEDFANPLTGETTPKHEVAAALVEQAQAEFPGQEVAVEHLHDLGDGTSAWHSTPPASPAPAGEQHATELSVEQSQEVQS